MPQENEKSPEQRSSEGPERPEAPSSQGPAAPAVPGEMSPTRLRPDPWWAPPKTSSEGQQVAPPKTPTPVVEAKDPLIDAVVGSFRLIRKLGGGGMGTVYLGEHTLIGSKVAVKFLHEHFASNEALVQRFLAEARAVNLIGHENIINIFDMNVLPPRRHYLVMEYLEGSPLSSMTSSPQSPSVIVPILTQVCDALQAAHFNGVVHRDLKPENIFLVRHDRTPHFVKVLDFGIAKLFDGRQAPGQTSLGTIIGTPEYMAPEQWAGKGVDGRTDLYALGIIAYELLTGRTPFGKGGLGSLLHAHLQEMPAAPHEVNPSVPIPLSQIVMRAMAKRPEERFQSASELRAALEQALTSDAPASLPSLGAPAAAVASPPPSLPPDTAMGSLPTALAPPRRPASPAPLEFPARVVLGPGLEPVRGVCTDLSRAGTFVCTEGTLPPLRSRVSLTLELRDRPLACTGEVVRHVTPAQASAWGMRAGFAVQFIELSTEARDALSRLAQGQSPPPAAPKAVADDPQAEALLAMLLQRMNTDPYMLLSLPQDATFDDVRQHSRAAASALETIAARPLSPRQAKELAEMRSRIEKAADLLGHARQRIEHDAWRGNYAGVARCISSGLTATEIESVRARYLLAHPGAEARERIHATTAGVWESQGKIDLALSEYEKALSADPLNLQLQQRYWTIKQRGVKPTPPPDNSPKGNDVPGLRRRRS
jgi:serine/threonine protein kinase